MVVHNRSDLQKTMEVEIISTTLSGRRRQRKNAHPSSNTFQTLQSSRSIETVDLTVSVKRKQDRDEDKDYMSVNGHSNSAAKKFKKTIVENFKEPEIIEVLPSRRSLPPRAARFTESYKGASPTYNLSEEEEEEVSEIKSEQNGECSEEEESSDSDCEIIPVSPIPPLTNDQQIEWMNKSTELQKKLRNEEVKLLLLKKLKTNQNMKVEKKENNSTTTSARVSTHVKRQTSGLKEITITPITESPCKKLMPVKPTVAKPLQKDLKVAPKSRPAEAPPNPVIKAEKPSISIYPITSQSTSSSTTTSTPKLPDSTVITKKTENKALTPLPPPQQPPPPPPPPPEKVMTPAEKEMALQQQAAAKYALRKQLEKTLLQISPKPPPSDMNFVPDPNSQEFMCLLGLELVVNFLMKTKPVSSACSELQKCYQCRTNFSQTWKWIQRKKHAKVLVCYDCFVYNSKKTLKAEHTNKLKAAFVKALQQEKEIEQMSKTITFTPISTLSSTPPTNKLVTCSPPILPPSSPSISNTSSIRTPPPNSPNLFMGNQALLMQQFAKLTPQQVQAILQVQAQNFMAANLPLSPHMVPLSPFIPQYPFHLMNKAPNSSPTELQRQYLLDMIPPRRKT